MNNSFQFDNNNMEFNQQSGNLYGQQPFTPNNNNDNNLGLDNFNNLNKFNNKGLENFNYLSNNVQNNLTNEFVDPNVYNGTSLDDNSSPDFKPLNYNNSLSQDPILIKSVAREIINGLKENNMSLYDNSSINSYKNLNNTYNVDELNSENNSKMSKSNSKQNSKSKNSNLSKTKNVVETLETLETFASGEKSIYSPKTYSEYSNWFFNDCFNYKDFLILFILYFVLSQEMVKDFFAKYFTSLNVDQEGKVGVQGVIIYGLILTILYMILKKIL